MDTNELFLRVEQLAATRNIGLARALRLVSVTHRTSGELTVVPALLDKFEQDPELRRQDVIAFAARITGPLTTAAKIANALPTRTFPESVYDHAYTARVGIPHAMSFLSTYRSPICAVSPWRVGWIVVPINDGHADNIILNTALKLTPELSTIVQSVADANGSSYGRAAYECCTYDLITDTYAFDMSTALYLLDHARETDTDRRELCSLLNTIASITQGAYVTAGDLVQHAIVTAVPSLLGFVGAERLGRLLSTAIRLNTDFIVSRKRGGNAWRWAVTRS